MQAKWLWLNQSNLFIKCKLSSTVQTQVAFWDVLNYLHYTDQTLKLIELLAKEMIIENSHQ